MLDWPYTEALRLDEALHPLTLLTFGMYGEVLPKQNGAPVRLVVRGTASSRPSRSSRFASSSRNRARPGTRRPPTNTATIPNVNPDVDHPRWSQATERRIGEDGLFAKRKTLLFNGYEAQVGQLYAGMDLRKNY